MSKEFGKKLSIRKKTLSNLNNDQLKAIYGGITGPKYTCGTCIGDNSCPGGYCPPPPPQSRRVTCANTCRHTCDDMTCFQRTCESCNVVICP